MKCEIRTHPLMPNHLDVSPKAKPIIERLINNMIYVEGGTFKMGAANFPYKVDDYFVGRFTVTLREYCAVRYCAVRKYEYVDEHFFKGLGKKGSIPFTKDFGVRWKFEIWDFIRALNELTGRKFRLLTEQEWEYAARGGKYSKDFKCAGSNWLDDVAWYWENVEDSEVYDFWDKNRVVDRFVVSAKQRVGKKQPNELGLFDMNGNVWEECANFFTIYEYTGGLPRKDVHRIDVLRGGSVESRYHDFDDYPVYSRTDNYNNVRDRVIGYRLAHDRIHEPKVYHFDVAGVDGC